MQCTTWYEVLNTTLADPGVQKGLEKASDIYSYLYGPEITNHPATKHVSDFAIPFIAQNAPGFFNVVGALSGLCTIYKIVRQEHMSATVYFCVAAVTLTAGNAIPCYL